MLHSAAGPISSRTIFTLTTPARRLSPRRCTERCSPPPDPRYAVVIVQPTTWDQFNEVMRQAQPPLWEVREILKTTRVWNSGSAGQVRSFFRVRQVSVFGDRLGADRKSTR